MPQGVGRIYPVGRLDYDSEGLLILTTDGELAQKLTHPSNEVPKTYLVKIEGTITETASQWRQITDACFSGKLLTI